jgi:hypothetical protein
LLGNNDLFVGTQATAAMRPRVERQHTPFKRPNASDISMSGHGRATFRDVGVVTMDINSTSVSGLGFGRRHHYRQ